MADKKPDVYAINLVGTYGNYRYELTRNGRDYLESTAFYNTKSGLNKAAKRTAMLFQSVGIEIEFKDLTVW